MLTFLDFLSEKAGTTGTYAAMRFEDHSNQRIVDYMRQNEIPNALNPNDLHVTLLYSRVECIGYTAKGTVKPPLHAKVKQLDVWPARDGKLVLVAELDAPELVQRHNDLMTTYGATYDFPQYKPHFTMSYDLGAGFDVSSLPPLVGDLLLDDEYQEVLNLDK